MSVTSRNPLLPRIGKPNMRLTAGLLILCSLVAWVGCGGTANHSEKKPTAKPAKGEHEHEEGHHHPGPHKGLVAAIGEDHSHHLEWTHDDDTGKVTLFVLDAEKTKAVPIAMENLVIVAEGKEYTLDAVNLEDGKSAQFELKDPDLLGVIESLSDKVTAEVREIEVGGKKYAHVKLVEDHDHD
jgi:hypothetical protein